MLTPGAPCALDEAQVVVGVEEQLRDREGRPCGLLREEGVDVLDADARSAGARSGRRRRRSRPRAGGRPEPRRALRGWTTRCTGARSIWARSMSCTSCGGALEVAEEVVVLGCAGGRISAQREEARDAGIQELADEASSALVGRADAREVGEGLDIRRLADVPDELERAPTGRSAGPVGHRDEPGTGRGEVTDRLVEGRRSGVGAGRIDLERERNGVEAARGHGAHFGRGTGRPVGRGSRSARGEGHVSSRAGAGLGCRSTPGMAGHFHHGRAPTPCMRCV